MKMQFDPFLCYTEEVNPFAVHVRLAMLRENTPEMEHLRWQYLENLYASQLPDGSWNGSVVQTVEALFVMKLLEVEPSNYLVSGMEYLLEGPMQVLPEDPAEWPPYAGLFRTMTAEDRKILSNRGNLFLYRGGTAFAKTGAILFLSANTPLEGDTRVIQAFRQLDRHFQKLKNRWGSLPSSNNILLAYVSHPVKKSSRTTRTALSYLERQQLKSGTWARIPDPIPTLFLLSHSTLPSAVRQFEKVFRWLVENQNQDGTWGKKDREITTFLALEAMMRRGYGTKRQGLKSYVDRHRKRLAPLVAREAFRPVRPIYR